jgi:hypothetical protein
MGQSTASDADTRGLRVFWPWIVLILLTFPAFWHVIHYESDLDPEFPKVLRPTFSRLPSPAYRLAEPGDTIDRVSIYFSCAGIVFCAIGMLGRREIGLWPAALAVVVAGFWEAANPGPTLDGWHGLGWRSMFNPSSPTALRVALALSASALLTVIGTTLWSSRSKLGEIWSRSRLDGSRSLWIVGLVLMIARYGEIPGVEPKGYWPRWCLAWGLVAIDLSLLRQLPRVGLRRAVVTTPIVLGCWLALVLGGIWLSWYHRPLSRLRPVVDNKIYISAMPTRRGLEVAYQRQPFKTIINLYPEDVLQRSEYLDEERAFAKEHGIHYVLSPGDSSLEASNAFLDETLRLAQDPSAWPILVHCHACMDRTPAWMGIYRFLVERKPLLGIMREIEQHRGYRPKSSVTLLYNRVLAERDPERYASDPTAAILRESARDVADPALTRPYHSTRPSPTNPDGISRVSQKDSTSTIDRRGPSQRK